MDPEQPVPGTGDGVMLAGLPADAVEAIDAAVGADSGSSLLSVEIRHLEGEFARVRPEHGVLAALKARFVLYAVGVTPTPEAQAAFAAAPAAQASSIVYAKDGNVWLTSPVWPHRLPGDDRRRLVVTLPGRRRHDRRSEGTSFVHHDRSGRVLGRLDGIGGSTAFTPPARHLERRRRCDDLAASRRRILLARMGAGGRQPGAGAGGGVRPHRHPHADADAGTEPWSRARTPSSPATQAPWPPASRPAAGHLPLAPPSRPLPHPSP